jgi:type II secretory pathway component PulF
MIGASRIATKPLEGLCRRLGLALEAGIDVRTAIAREADRASGFTARRHLRAVSDAIHDGASIQEAIKDTDAYFPDLFHAVVHVGEESGHLGESLGQLADHYEGQLRLRRRFLAAIAWPMIELGLSVFLIGFLIWILGVIGESTGQKIDILGYGLVGNRGLLLYVTFVGVVAAAVFSVIHAIRRGVGWVKPVQRLVLKLPGIGKPLETIALARLTWALSMTFNSGMDLRRALKLSLEATRNSHFTDQIRPIDEAVGGGCSLYDAFSGTLAFPSDFLDSLHAAEESGKLVDSMAHLSRQYQDQAEAALHVLTTLAGFAVWGAIAIIIIFAIFRIFSFYLQTIQSALP